MLDYIVTDIELRNAVLREWREPRPAFVVAASPDREFHPWHFTTSTSTLSGGALVAPDVPVISGYWAGTMAFNPDGAVSTALAEHLKKPAHFHLA